MTDGEISPDEARLIIGLLREGPTSVQLAQPAAERAAKPAVTLPRAPNRRAAASEAAGAPESDLNLQVSEAARAAAARFLDRPAARLKGARLAATTLARPPTPAPLAATG